ncbi:hypothetical protein Tco_0187482, partial [Tanacetum coccineum]
YVFVLNGSAVDWKSSKQSTTIMSATEAEYIAASDTWEVSSSLLIRAISEVILKHGDKTLVINKEFVPSIVEE